MKSSPLSWQEPTTLKILEKALRQDEVVLTSTDTVPGLLGRLSQSAFEALNAAKERSGKPYLILVDSVEQAQKFIGGPVSPRVQELMATAWPGPLTLILPAKPDVPAFMKSAQGAIALRVPDHQGLQKLLQSFDGLFSTSANLAGQPVPGTVQDVDPVIVQAVAHVVDGGPSRTLASTILDCTGEQIKVVREGAYSLQQFKL